MYFNFKKGFQLIYSIVWGLHSTHNFQRVIHVNKIKHNLLLLNDMFIKISENLQIVEEILLNILYIN